MKNTDYQIQRRLELEQQLDSIPPIEELTRKIISADGFCELFLKMRKLYPSQKKAYERLEDYHIKIVGRRKYTEFDSFRHVFYKK